MEDSFEELSINILAFWLMNHVYKDMQELIWQKYII